MPRNTDPNHINNLSTCVIDLGQYSSKLFFFSSRCCRVISMPDKRKRLFACARASLIFKLISHLQFASLSVSHNQRARNHGLFSLVQFLSYGIRFASVLFVSAYCIPRGGRRLLARTTQYGLRVRIYYFIKNWTRYIGFLAF